MSSYILLRLEPEPPVPCLVVPSLTLGTPQVHSELPLLPRACSLCTTTVIPKGWGLVTVCENLIFNPADVQFVHHRNTSALFSPPTVDIVYKSYSITIDCLWFTPCSVLWTSRRSRSVRSTNSLSTDRILMATINDYLMDNYRTCLGIL